MALVEVGGGHPQSATRNEDGILKKESSQVLYRRNTLFEKKGGGDYINYLNYLSYFVIPV